MHILLVEDDRQLRASVGRGLREAGYEVDEAEDGESAIDRARSRSYDCIVLDILLPGRDGIDVCRELRSRGNWVPILMLTALDAVEDRIRGLDAGADDYLPKPFDFDELLARVRAVTRRGGEEAEERLRVGDLVIDTSRRSVRRGDREIELTAREFDFLVHLARHAGRVVPREEIMDRVWRDSQPRSNVIDVYASRLRSKIDSGSDTSLLVTHHGVGYALEADDLPSGEARDSED